MSNQSRKPGNNRSGQRPGGTRPPGARPGAASNPAGGTTNRRSTTSQRAVAARAEREAAAARRRRLATVLTAVGVVVVVVIVLIVVKVAGGSKAPKSGKKAAPAPVSVSQAIADVPRSMINAVGAGSGTTAPSAAKSGGTPLTANGLPRVLYVGAEWCPFCAAERWPLAVALARFGTFTNLGQITSAASDSFPNTPTLTFHGATYRSKYVAFSGKEVQSNQAVDGRFPALDKLSAADSALWKSNTNGGGFPFADLAGRYMISGAEYSPQILHGLTHAQIAKDLSNPKSQVGRSIVGAANIITAALCQSTGQQPGAVCTSAGVRAAAAKLKTSPVKAPSLSSSGAGS